MQEKLKEIIDSYPEFSRETVFNIVSEFNAKTLEEKKKQNKEKIFESFTTFGIDKIYLFEKTSRKYKLIIIQQKENNVFIKYREIFQEGKIEMNFSEGVDIVEKGIKWEWDSLIDIKFTSGMKEDELNLHFFYYFYIYKDGLEYFLLKNIMLYLSKKSLVALDFVKALKEVGKYNIVFEIPRNTILNTKDFFSYGTLASMIAEKKGIKQVSKFRKIPISFIPAALVCNIPKDAEFIFSDIARNKEIYLKVNSDLCFCLCNWAGFAMSFLEVNRIAEKWKVDLKMYKEGGTKNKEKIDIIYDILEAGEKLGEINILNKLIKKNTFNSVNKMAEQLKKKLLAQEMETVKPQKFKIGKEFEELDKMLKEHFSSIEMINEEQCLFFEGFEQKNCVYSYYKEKIKNNEEIIFSLKVKKEDNESGSKIPYGRYTISIEKIRDADNYHFKVTEVRKKANISDEDTKIVSEKISKVIEDYNKNLSEAKTEKINCFIKNINDFSGKEKIVNFLNAIKININPFESKDNFLVFTEFDSTRKIEAEVLKDKININFFLKIFLELSEKDKQNNKKDFEEEIQISFSLKKDGEAFFNIKKINCSSEKLFSSMINFIFDFFSDKKMMKDIKIIFEEMEEEKKKENLFISLPIPAISYKELINCDSFVSYILSRTETKKTNLKRMDIENLTSNKYAKFFIHHFLFTVPEVNEMPEEEKIKLKAEFLEKYLKHSENFKQLLRDFCGFPLTLAELERQYFEVSGKLEEMGISFKDKDEVNRTYFEKLIENIQENSKNIREKNIDLKHLEFSFEGFENENKELFIENLISKPYRIYEATKNFRKTEQFEALNKDLAFLANKELLEQAQNIPLENSGTVTEFLENFKNEKVEFLKIITTEREYVENCLILNIEPEIERTNKVENVISILQVKDMKIKLMLESSLKDNKINFEIKNPFETINNEIISIFENKSEKFFLEKEILSKAKERNEENETDLEIPEWFEIFLERYLPNNLAIKNSKTLSYASEKFKNDSYEKFKSGNFENRICSFSNENFWEFSYNEDGITDIIFSKIDEKPFSVRKVCPGVLNETQQFYKEVIEEMEEKE